MRFRLLFQPKARRVLEGLRTGKRRDPKKLKRVEAALALLQENPRHPRLRTHQMTNTGSATRMISYVENGTPGAWRIYWSYGASEDEISVISVEYVGPHE